MTSTDKSWPTYINPFTFSWLLPSLLNFFHQLLLLHHLFTIKYNPLSFIVKGLINLEILSYHILFMIKCHLIPQMDVPPFVIFSNKLHATSQTWEEFLRNIFKVANCYHISSLPLKFCIMMLMKNVGIHLLMHSFLLHIDLDNIVSEIFFIYLSFMTGLMHKKQVNHDRNCLLSLFEMFSSLDYSCMKEKFSCTFSITWESITLTVDYIRFLVFLAA